MTFSLIALMQLMHWTTTTVALNLNLLPKYRKHSIIWPLFKLALATDAFKNGLKTIKMLSLGIGICLTSMAYTLDIRFLCAEPLNWLQHCVKV